MARRLWLCEVRDGRITEVVGYCNGGWDARAARPAHAVRGPDAAGRDQHGGHAATTHDDDRDRVTAAPVTVDAVLDAVRALAPTIAARAAEIEAARRLPADLLDALVDAGCFRMLLPASHGGARRRPAAPRCGSRDAGRVPTPPRPGR